MERWKRSNPRETVVTHWSDRSRRTEYQNHLQSPRTPMGLSPSTRHPNAAPGARPRGAPSDYEWLVCCESTGEEQICTEMCRRNQKDKLSTIILYVQGDLAHLQSIPMPHLEHAFEEHLAILSDLFAVSQQVKSKYVLKCVEDIKKVNNQQYKLFRVRNAAIT